MTPTTSTSASRYNVVLLVFDTLRPDYLAPYGADTDTPAFTELAGQGVLFESAFGTAPGTPVSHASLYTGQYPSEHGVTGQYIDLPGDDPVLASWFQSAGYDTFGITGPAKMGSDWEYDRGFDDLYEHYHDLPEPTSTRNVTRSLTDGRFRRYFLRQLTRGGREKTRFKRELLEDRIRENLDRPFFALANFATVHAPYSPPRPYKQRATPGFSRPRLFLTEYLLDDPGTFDDPEIRTERVMNAQTADGIGRYLADPDYLNEKEVEVLRRWYAATVEYLDEQFGRFLEFYRRELADDTVLVATADHGEQLGEHGLWEHSHLLFDETTQVPLVVVGPDLPGGRRRTDLASHVDFFDTLCDLCDLDAPPTTSGSSLFDGEQRDAVFMEYGERDPDDFASTAQGRHLGDDQLRRLCAGRKAVRTRDHRFEVASNGTDALYELPTQRKVPADPAETATLRDRLLETLGGEFGVWPEGDPDDGQVDEQVRRNLRELGYIE